MFQRSLFVFPSGCNRTWDKITCWPGAEVGEVITIPCPKYLFYFSRDIPTRKSRVYKAAHVLSFVVQVDVAVMHTESEKV